MVFHFLLLCNIPLLTIPHLCLSHFHDNAYFNSFQIFLLFMGYCECCYTHFLMCTDKNFFEVCTRHKIGGYRIWTSLTLPNIIKLFSKHSLRGCIRVPVVLYPVTLGFVKAFFIFVSLMDMKWNLIVVLICILLKTSKAVFSFMFLLLDIGCSCFLLLFLFLIGL